MRTNSDKTPPRSRVVTNPEVSNTARTSLAAKQRLLVAALVENADPPVDFDASQIATAADSLARKRARGVAKAWPALAAALGDQFPLQFADYARSRPPAAGGGLPEGRLFARWLENRQQFPRTARLELLHFDSQYRETGDKFIRRRIPNLKMLLHRLYVTLANNRS